MDVGVKLIAAGAALYLWAGLSTYLATRIMRIEAEAWIGRKLPPDEPGTAISLLLFLCIWWLAPLVLVYAIWVKWQPSPLDRMSSRIYQEWLAVQLSDDAVKRSRERATAEAAIAADEYENEHD